MKDPHNDQLFSNFLSERSRCIIELRKASENGDLLAKAALMILEDLEELKKEIKKPHRVF